MSALDQSPSNPSGLPAYQWTNWQSVFQPRLGAQLQPAGVSPGTSGADIIASRQAARDQVIQANPLWSGMKPAQPSMFANVTEAGSSGEDSQAMFGAVNDGMSHPIASGPAPAANRDFQATPVSGRTINSKYGTASVRFNSPNTGLIANGGMGFGNKMYGGGGSTLRF